MKASTGPSSPPPATTTIIAMIPTTIPAIIAAVIRVAEPTIAIVGPIAVTVAVR
jgi:hypothetical protein